jgi:hypothetical protein
MTVSEVGICNVALHMLGISRQISALTDNSAEARPCNLFYSKCRDRAFEDFPWPFASRFVELVLVDSDDGTQAWTGQYRNRFRYPTSCARVLRIATGAGKRDPKPPPFDISSDATGRLICTNFDEDPTNVEYTHIITDATLYTETFANAVSALLAYHIAKPLRAEATAAADAFNAYLLAVRQASRVASNEPEREEEPIGPLLSSRLGTVGPFGVGDDHGYYPSGFVVP